MQAQTQPLQLQASSAAPTHTTFPPRKRKLSPSNSRHPAQRRCPPPSRQTNANSAPPTPSVQRSADAHHLPATQAQTQPLQLQASSATPMPATLPSDKRKLSPSNSRHPAQRRCPPPSRQTNANSALAVVQRSADDPQPIRQTTLFLAGCTSRGRGCCLALLLQEGS